MAAADYYTQVYTMFVGYYGRPPAQSGLDYYAGLVDKAGGSMAVVIDDFFKSAESQAFFAGKSVEQQVNQIFQNLFGRDALPAGLNYWAGLITNGTVALSQAAYTIANNAAAADVAVRDAKVASAKAWVAGLDTTAEILAFGTDAGREAGRDFLKVVTTSTPATQAAVDAALKAMVDGGTTNPGQTFTLTTGVDVIPGLVGSNGNTSTAGNDTVIAGPGSAGGAHTLGAADMIDAGAGTDTLKITTDGAAAMALGIGSLKNTEVVEVQGLTTAGGTTLNLVNASGVKEIWNVRSTDAVGVAVNNVQELATVGVRGEITGGSLYTVSFKDSLAVGTDDTVKVAVDGATITNLRVGGATAANEFENLEFVATGTSTVTNLFQTGGAVLAATKTVKASGDGKLTVTAALAGTVTDVDASANNGGVSFNLTATGAVKATGGKGNDTFAMGASLTTADVLNGGEGTNTVGVTTGASLVTGLQVTNFQTLDIGGADNQTGANAYDVSKLTGITTLKVGTALNGTAAAQTTTVNNLAKLAGVEINAAVGNAAADVLAINVKDSGAGSPNDVIDVLFKANANIATTGDIQVKDIETINLSTDKSTAIGTVTHTVAKFTANQALTVAVKGGNAGLTITDLDATSLVLFDASTATQAVSLTTGADVYTGTNGVAFKLGQAADTLVLTDATVAGGDFWVTGGAGGDKITLTAAVAEVEHVVYVSGTDSQAGLTATGASKYDVVSTFTGGEDKIDLKALNIAADKQSFFTKGTTAAPTAITNTGEVAAADKLNFFVNAGTKNGVAIAAAADVDANTGGAQAGVFVYVDTNGDGNFDAAQDLTIALVGVTIGAANNIAAGDIVFA